MNRTAITVRLGLPLDGKDWPVTCTPIAGGAPCFCYMPREMANQLTFGETAYCWAEFNGASYDFIDFMSDDEVARETALEAEIPF